MLAHFPRSISTTSLSQTPECVGTWEPGRRSEQQRNDTIRDSIQCNAPTSQLKGAVGVGWGGGRVAELSLPVCLPLSSLSWSEVARLPVWVRGSASHFSSYNRIFWCSVIEPPRNNAIGTRWNHQGGNPSRFTHLTRSIKTKPKRNSASVKHSSCRLAHVIKRTKWKQPLYAEGAEGLRLIGIA